MMSKTAFVPIQKITVLSECNYAYTCFFAIFGIELIPVTIWNQTSLVCIISDAHVCVEPNGRLKSIFPLCVSMCIPIQIGSPNKQSNGSFIQFLQVPSYFWYITIDMLTNAWNRLVGFSRPFTEHSEVI